MAEWKRLSKTAAYVRTTAEAIAAAVAGSNPASTTKFMNAFQINLPMSLLPCKYWAYERAFAVGRIIEMSDMHNDVEVVRALHDQFSKAFRVYSDNKQTFACECLCLFSDEPEMLYFTFHDNRLFVGKSVRPYRGDVLPDPDKVME